MIYSVLNWNQLFDDALKWMRVNTKKLTAKLLTAHWTREQDIILIENNNLPIEQLSEMLNCSQEDIMARRKVLGLVTRNKQLRRLL